MLWILLPFLFLLVGTVFFALGYFAKQVAAKSAKDAARHKPLLEVAGEAIADILNRDLAREDKQLKIEERSTALNEREQELQARHLLLEGLKTELSAQKKSLNQKDEDIKKQKARIDALRTDYEERLSKISSLTCEDARRELLKSLQARLEEEEAKTIKERKRHARESADEAARCIISTAILRSAVDVAKEQAALEITLPNDATKGKLIGREGKNIKTFESETGAKLIIEDEPCKVTLSSFDGVKREIARRVLADIIAVETLTPSLIVESAKKHSQSIGPIMEEIGTKAFKEVLGDKNASAHPELLRLMGSLKFRSSYGQEVLAHSVEVSHLAGAMAAELGFDEILARRAGFFHDIGKAVTTEKWSDHTEIGAKIALEYGECETVVNAIASHHEDIEPLTPIATLIEAADAISGSRPGARSLTVGDHARKLEDIERVATSVPGVSSAYAIHGGHEVRVIVSDYNVNDLEATELADKIAKRIQSEIEYIGKINVTVIREKRTTGYA